MCSKQCVQSIKLRTLIQWILAQLEPKATLLQSFKDRSVQSDIFCFSEGRTTEAPSLERSLRERCRFLGLTIGIDHYDITET